MGYLQNGHRRGGEEDHGRRSGHSAQVVHQATATDDAGRHPQRHRKGRCVRKQFSVLKSAAGQAAFVLQIVDTSWCQLIAKVGEGSPAWTGGAQQRRLERLEEIARTLENAQVQSFVELAIAKDRKWAFTGNFKLELRPRGITSRSPQRYPSTRGHSRSVPNTRTTVPRGSS